jgi:NADH-quinone oxidoreductase subunit C
LSLEGLIESFPEVVWEDGPRVAHVPAADWYRFAEAVRDSGYEMCSDVTAVDWMRSRPERFQVVATLTSLSRRERLRMVTTVGREGPSLASITPIWPGAGFAEREVYDMFGIVFEGHPDLTRILMPDEVS